MGISESHTFSLIDIGAGSRESKASSLNFRACQARRLVWRWWCCLVLHVYHQASEETSRSRGFLIPSFRHACLGFDKQLRVLCGKNAVIPLASPTSFTSCRCKPHVQPIARQFLVRSVYPELATTTEVWIHRIVGAVNGKGINMKVIYTPFPTAPCLS